ATGQASNRATDTGRNARREYSFMRRIISRGTAAGTVLHEPRPRCSALPERYGPITAVTASDITAPAPLPEAASSTRPCRWNEQATRLAKTGIGRMQFAVPPLPATNAVPSRLTRRVHPGMPSAGSGGTAHWPTSLNPQATTEPLLRRATVWY